MGVSWNSIICCYTCVSSSHHTNNYPIFRNKKYTSDFSGGRHQRRLTKIVAIEQGKDPREVELSPSDPNSMR